MIITKIVSILLIIDYDKGVIVLNRTFFVIDSIFHPVHNLTSVCFHPALPLIPIPNNVLISPLSKHSLKVGWKMIEKTVGIKLFKNWVWNPIHFDLQSHRYPTVQLTITDGYHRDKAIGRNIFARKYKLPCNTVWNFAIIKK